MSARKPITPRSSRPEVCPKGIKLEDGEIQVIRTVKKINSHYLLVAVVYRFSIMKIIVSHFSTVVSMLLRLRDYMGM